MAGSWAGACLREPGWCRSADASTRGPCNGLDAQTGQTAQPRARSKVVQRPLHCRRTRPLRRPEREAKNRRCERKEHALAPSQPTPRPPSLATVTTKSKELAAWARGGDSNALARLGRGESVWAEAGGCRAGGGTSAAPAQPAVANRQEGMTPLSRADASVGFDQAGMRF